MSVYGNVLAAFPELFKVHQIFSMEPAVGGGYTNRTNIAKRVGAFIRDGRDKMGIHGEARVKNEAGIFFCYEFTPADRIPQGVYFELDGQLFVFAADQTYSSEGGFAAYSCQLVSGNTDQQIENPETEDKVISDFQI